ncbi:MAG: InlB B-repeat-containing protein [Acutalibacteraceae bacterium]|jgi:uncharacterized repeat protein (TIGR02543 family)
MMELSKKSFNKKLSLFLAAALVLTSLLAGFGQIKTEAAPIAGTGFFKLEIAIDSNSGTSSPGNSRGTDSSFTLRLVNAGGGVIGATPTNAITGTGSPDPLENGRTTTYSSFGAGGNVAVIVSEMAALGVTSAITQMHLACTSQADDWWFADVRLYYSTTGNNANWVQLTSGGWQAGSGTGAWNISWFANNEKTITFDTQGGTGNVSYEAVPGQTLTSPTGSFTKPGYTFNGWNTPARMPNANHTVYANWIPNTYNIAFNGNGSTGGSTGGMTCAYGTAYNLTSNGFTKNGYNFVCWNTNAGGTGTNYNNGASVSNLTTVNNATVTLYAQWAPITYTVKYNPEGGTGTTADSLHTFDQDKALTVNGFSRYGYTFDGWAVTSGGSRAYDNGQTVKNLTNVQGATFDLYARWEPITYYVSYDVNSTSGHSGTMNNSTHQYGIPAQLNYNVYSKLGYTFLGWATSQQGANAGEVTYEDHDYVQDLTGTPNATVVLYAVWGANQYLVRYNGNGATGGTMADSAHWYDQNSRLRLNTFTRTGYAFDGWNTQADGSGTAYTDNQEVLSLVPSGIVTLYAQWIPNTYTVSYSGNGATDGNMSTSAHTYDVSKALNANGYTKIGHSFQGWALTNNATTPEFGDGDSVVNLTAEQNEIVTLYAVWQINKYNVYYNANGGTGTYGPVNQDYDTPVPLPESGFTWAGREFRGWNPVQSAVDPVTTYRVPANDSTLYAVWGADYSGVNASIALANAAMLPANATKDPQYIPGGALYPYAGGGNNGLYARSMFSINSLTALTNAVNVVTPGLRSDQQATVDGWKAAIDEAYANLTLASSDYSLLQGRMTYVDNINRDLYTEASLMDLDEAYQGAQNTIAQNYKLPLQNWVDTAKNNLDTAINNLVYRPADYSNVTAVWESVPPDYQTTRTPETVNALNEYYNAIDWSLTMENQAIVDEYAAVLTDLINALEFLPADYTVVYNALKSIPDNDGGLESVNYEYLDAKYTPASVQSLRNAVEAVVYDYVITQQQQVDQFASNITYEKNTLVPKAADKTGLYQALQRIAPYPSNYYTNITWNEYADARSVALTLYNDQNLNIFDQEEIDLAADRLNAAVDNLQFLPVTYTVYYEDAAGNALASAAVKDGYASQAVREYPITIYGYAPDVEYENLTLDNTNNGTITFTYSYGTYTLSFDSAGGSAVNSITQIYNTDVTAPADPEREGYTFAGWQPAVPSKMPGEDTECVAQWTINDYTVSFDSAGGSAVDSITQNYGTAITAPAAPTKEGYTFMGWQPAVPPVMPAEDVECVAQWQINQYTVSFDSAGGSDVESITQDYATSITAPAAPTKEGYTFMGWQPVVPTTMPAENTECVAQWQINQYTVSFDSAGGSAVESITQNYGTAITAPADPTKEGYTFMGWQPVVPTTMPAENVECVAQWQINQYTVNFNSNGGSAVGSITQNYGTDVSAPDVPAKTGHTFAGWYSDSGLTTAVTWPYTMGASNVTFYAKWTLNNYNITFDANGGTGGTGPTSMAYDSPLNAPVVSRTGYSFVEWLPEVPPTVPAQDTTYTAQWTINSYTVNFNSNGGSAVGSITQNYGTDVSAPDAPTKTGHTFAGWYSDSGLTTAVTWPYTLGASDVTFYADWTVNNYNITFDANGGTGGTGPTSMAYGSPLNAPVVTRTGYSLVEWLPEVPPTVPAQDTTYTAQWTINQYTVSFDSAGGSAVGSITQNYGTSVTAPADPVKEGYTFKGWLPLVPTVMPAEDVECVAQWQVNQYTVSFDSAGGSAVADITQDYGTSITPPANPVKEGYTFTGWLPAIPATMPSANATCVAQWQINQYTISFDSRGGSPVTSITQDYGTAITAPADPVKQGDVFLGWYPQIPATMPGNDLQCVAVWSSDNPQLVEAVGSTTVIDTSNSINLIYGLEIGISQTAFEALFVDVIGNGYTVITQTDYGFGTGTKVELYHSVTHELVETYYIVIFGDVNGDGNVDSMDADLVEAVEKFEVFWDWNTEFYLYKASDINGDMNVDSMDSDWMITTENFLSWIDQTDGLAYEY